jgi:hypothetical protein
VATYRLVRRRAGGYGALRAPVTRVGAVDDGDLAWIRRCAGLRDRSREGEDGEESYDFGKHLERFWFLFSMWIGRRTNGSWAASEARK